MTKITLLSTSLAAMLVALLPATPAQALELVTFVSSTGSGAACTRASPCGNFQNAHNATLPGGEINCLDSGPFSGAFITNSITIDCAGTGAKVFFDAFVVGAPDIVVRIRNLTLNGFSSGTIGIDFQNGAVLFVENCVIESFNGAPGIGIMFEPSASARLVVTETIINGSGVISGPTAGTGGGIVVRPQPGRTAQVSLERVTAADNNFGIAADGFNSTGGINMTIANSTVHRNPQGGIVACQLFGAGVQRRRRTFVSGKQLRRSQRHQRHVLGFVRAEIAGKQQVEGREAALVGGPLVE
jgi:hypothetical protein